MPKRTPLRCALPGRTTLLLFMGVAAQGCSRDAPPMAPQLHPDARVAAPAAATVSPAPDSTSATASDRSPVGPALSAAGDALQRLIPAIGARGAALRVSLLRLEARSDDPVALDDLRRALDALGTTLPAEHSADLDALRLQLGVPFPK